MPFPNFKEKHKGQSLFSPTDWFNYLDTIGRLDIQEIPEDVVLVFSKGIRKEILQQHETTKVSSLYDDFYFLPERNVGVIKSFPGPSATAVLMDELGALGVKRFLILGFAGSLQPEIELRDVVVCDKAIRDDGVSHHYVEPAKFAYPSRSLMDTILKRLQVHEIPVHVGGSWTISTPYRETVEEVKHYQKAGMLTVEMEAATLFAIAQYRKLEASAIFIISDLLRERKWKPAFYRGILTPKLLDVFSKLDDAPFTS
ncbi:MAG: nucleoside phosphorylase [Candidatus Korarchaeota archaeon]|nr:nucleoside phosphorylase [Candidatus Korarchaeota archaeon]NIU82325.1 purine phosphorylase [Candidatus Thorarchaeota archaeon]NIW12809.1 purine phosphorylase [Candidatus Thorarchaeota archaeon]NIW51006.1 purine phosphorylase [Candidatus Korarchaeota archaeon]